MISPARQEIINLLGEEEASDNASGQGRHRLIRRRFEGVRLMIWDKRMVHMRRKVDLIYYYTIMIINILQPRP